MTQLTAPLASAKLPSSNCFCTYDVRAIVNEQFNERNYERLGLSFAAWLQQRVGVENQLWVCVGWDARTHSPQLADALIKSLLQAGVGVISVGLVPSPLVYFSEVHLVRYPLELAEAPIASIVVTASHNPAPYNGAKFTYQGLSFSREDLHALRKLYEDPLLTLPSTQRGVVLEWHPHEAYLQWFQENFKPFQTKPKIVIDCGNGTAGVIAPAVLHQLGCDVIPLFEEPDGRFPNHHPDPCVHQNLLPLMDAVQKTSADFGIAFDGDTDRLGVVDDKGHIIPGDQLLMLYAQAVMEQWTQVEQPIMISEVKCSQHLFNEITRLGASAVMSPTGHAFIKKAMREQKAVLGGELSGHMFFMDRHWGFDDAIYAAARLVEVLDAKRIQMVGAKLSILTEALPKSALSEERRVFLEKSSRQSVIQHLLEKIYDWSELSGLKVKSVVTLDGVRVNLEGGFALVRLSNTEPCLTLRFEAPNDELLVQMESDFMLALTQSIHYFLPNWADNPNQATH